MQRVSDCAMLGGRARVKEWSLGGGGGHCLAGRGCHVQCGNKPLGLGLQRRISKAERAAPAARPSDLGLGCHGFLKPYCDGGSMC